MAIHSEHISAHAGITHAGPFSIVDGDLLSATQHAVILSSDDVVVIRGSLADLRTFHARLGALLDAEPEHVCGDDDECETCDDDDDDDDDTDAGTLLDGIESEDE